MQHYYGRTGSVHFVCFNVICLYFSWCFNDDVFIVIILRHSGNVFGFTPYIVGLACSKCGVEKCRDKLCSKNNSRMFSYYFGSVSQVFIKYVSNMFTLIFSTVDPNRDQVKSMYDDDSWSKLTPRFNRHDSPTCTLNSNNPCCLSLLINNFSAHISHISPIFSCIF